MSSAIAQGYEEYFRWIEEEVNRLYSVARKARSKGYDPSNEPESKLAYTIAERVEKLVGPLGVAKRISELSQNLSREEVALKTAEEIVEGRFGEGDRRQLIEQAIRTALAILTEGVTVAPLQGIVDVAIKKNPDGSDYLAIYFAGPIRSAGGTEQALILVIADQIRKKAGLDRYKPTIHEVKRFVEEVRTYEREVGKFQYHVGDEELSLAYSNLPIEVTGTETDKVEVTAFRDLPRIETNRVRAGALRVVNDGVVGRARKVLKIVESLGIEGWEWLSGLKPEASSGDSQGKVAEYMEDVVAGRPIFSFPSRVGGFRLRYGRARNTGLAAVGVHPSTMVVSNGFIAIGTQLKLEGPGKAGAVLPVDSIEPPVVKLVDGSIVRVDSPKEAEKLLSKIEKILFLGDLLVAFGEFLENNVSLQKPGYCEEMWAEEFRHALEKNPNLLNALSERGVFPDYVDSLVKNPLSTIPSAEQAIAISEVCGVPIHPRYTYFWTRISVEELLKLREVLKQSRRKLEDGRALVARSEFVEEVFEKLCVPCEAFNGGYVLGSHDALVLERVLGLEKEGIGQIDGDVLTALKKLSGLEVRDKAGAFIGARMGRPEKAKQRELTASVNVLFPIGLAGGSQRNVSEAAKKSVVHVELCRFRCLGCGEIVAQPICPKCGSTAKPEARCTQCGRVGEVDEGRCSVCGGALSLAEKRPINLRELLDAASKRLGVFPPTNLKGVKKLMSEEKVPELIDKGILRALHGLPVFKDGTTRYDATNAPLTHFTPREIGVSVEKLRQLGYTHDAFGNELVNEDQICELKVQDVIVPKSCGDFLVKVACFIDDLLERLYGLDRYYNAKTHEDLVGHLIVGLAPHTSVGVVGRIIGYTDAQVCYAHPYWHAAKRRDCDGDEDAVMLMLDVLLNFSENYLPSQIGGKMDAPLLITPIINPAEVDDEAHNVDVGWRYPLELYLSACQGEDAKPLSQIIDVVRNRLGSSAQYAGFGYTHHVTDINSGVLESAYKRFESMVDKMEQQLRLAEKIEAVDEAEVAKLILQSHFMRDIAGNLKAFTTQSFRCKKCNAKYRRIPLSGRCSQCGGEISMTVFRGTVEKYLSVAEQLATRYGVGDYSKQRLSIIKEELSLLFAEDLEEARKQMKLSSFI